MVSKPRSLGEFYSWCHIHLDCLCIRFDKLWLRHHNVSSQYWLRCILLGQYSLSQSRACVFSGLSLQRRGKKPVSLSLSLRTQLCALDSGSIARKPQSSQATSKRKAVRKLCLGDKNNKELGMSCVRNWLDAGSSERENTRSSQCLDYLWLHLLFKVGNLLVPSRFWMHLPQQIMKSSNSQLPEKRLPLTLCTSAPSTYSHACCDLLCFTLSLLLETF